MKRVLKVVGIVLGCIVGLVLLFVGYLSITEYRPDDVEYVVFSTVEDADVLVPGQSITVLSYNTGYAGLDASMDFFMDGGEQVNPHSWEQVEQNIFDICGVLGQNQADIYLLQEVDVDSGRTFGINQTVAYSSQLPGYGAAFATNYKCGFVPFPLPPIGRVESGIYTLSGFNTTAANRISLPCPFAWPIRAANLKRCLLETRYPIEGTEQELVVFNLHLEAYDDGEGKRVQTELLVQLLQAEYEKGNYVIAGGDFNQTFPGSLELYPILNTENWVPGTLEQADLPAGFSYAVDNSLPTCRLLNEPYNPETAQLYVIDGFIISPNLQLEQVRTLQTEFSCSDHQPVSLTVKLGE